MNATTKVGSIISFLTVFIMLISCGKQKSEWKGTIEEENGVTVVKNPKEPIKSDMRFIFEEDLTIGVEDGEESYMFGKQVFLNTDDEGNFYVTDWDRKIIKKYNPEGNYLMSIGRPGQGPGEFQNISVVRFDIEGNIYLNDIVNRRISFLNKDGRYIRGIKVPSLFERLYMNSEGYFIAQITDDIEEGYVNKWDLVYGLFDDEFDLVKELFRVHYESKRPTGRDEDSIAEFLANAISRDAFKPYVNYDLDKRDFLYFGFPKNYEIKVYSAKGKLNRIIQREFNPIEISGKHKEGFVKKHAEPFMDSMPERVKHLKKKVIDLIKYPKYKPAYERFALMENGWIFVVVNSIQDKYALVDIFDKDGQYLTQFETDISTDWLSFNN